MLEKSAARELARVKADKIRESAIWRAIGVGARAITGTVGGIVTGVLFPREIADSTIYKQPSDFLEEIVLNTGGFRAPRRMAPRQVPPQPPPRLDPIPAPQIPRKPLRPVPPKRAAPTPVTPRQTRPIRLPSARNRLFNVNQLATGAITALIQRPQRSAYRDPLFADPGVPPGIDPLTPIRSQPVPLPSGSGSTRTPSLNDYCKQEAKKKREKRRKCRVRGNVVWSSGSKKGQLAGTKCMEFE